VSPTTVGIAGEVVLGPPTEFTLANIDQFNELFTGVSGSSEGPPDESFVLLEEVFNLD
jgi:hypothetical protein